MKKVLYSLLALIAMATTVQAATKYGFKVGGVDVTSDNCNNVTGSNIKSGTVKYVPSEKKLYMTDVKISRTGSDNRAIYNESCNNLTIVFKGTNDLAAKDAAPLRFQVDTNITCEDGGTATITGTDEDAICPYNGSLLYIYNADLKVNASNSRAFEANNSGLISIDNSTITASGKYGAISRVKSVIIGGWKTRLTLSTNNNAVTVNDVENMRFYTEIWEYKDECAIDGSDTYTYITAPTAASFNKSKKAIVTSSASSGYKGEVKIESDAVEITMANFPDEVFWRYVLTNLDSKIKNRYLGRNERNAVTAISCTESGMKNMKGIELFPMLKSITYEGGTLNNLDVSKNTNLEEINIANNKLTSLNVSKNTKLTKLSCYCNQINGSNMQALVESLPKVSSGKLIAVKLGDSKENNVITKSQVAIAKGKGWTVYNQTGSGLQSYDGSDDPKVPANLSFSATTLTATFGQSFTVPKLTNPFNVSVTWTSSNTAVATVNNSGTVTIKGAGTTTITAKFAGNNSYEAAEVSYTITVAKAKPVVTAPMAISGLVYNGSLQVLIKAGSTTGGEMQYSLDGTTWDVAVPMGKEAKEYTVYWRVVGGQNYEDVAVKTLKVTIDSSTGIEANNCEPITDNREGWYTLDGRKLQGEPTQKGIYIYNGRKIRK